MRAIVWSTMIRILIVFVVVLIMFQIFSFAFSSGTNVLEGGLSWVEGKTGLDLGGSGGGVYSIAFQDRDGSLEYVIDLAESRDNPVSIEIVTDQGIRTRTIGPDEEDGTVSAALVFDVPAAYIRVSLWEMRETEGSSSERTRLASRDIIAVKLSAFETGTAGGIIDAMISGLKDQEGGEPDGAAFIDRLERTVSVLESACDLPRGCGDIHPTAIYENCVLRDLGDECIATKATAASQLYCVRPGSWLDAYAWDEELALEARIDPSAQCSGRDAARARLAGTSGGEVHECFELPLERSLDCSDDRAIIWRDV